jgi:hypothetical protein
MPICVVEYTVSWLDGYGIIGVIFLGYIVRLTYPKERNATLEYNRTFTRFQ